MNCPLQTSHDAPIGTHKGLKSGLLWNGLEQ
jgi:hypothetical protein